MYLKKRLLIFFAVIFLFPFVQSADFSVQERAVDNDIFPYDNAFFNINVENHQNFDDEFDLSFTNDPKWSVQTKPTIYYSSQYGMQIKAGEMKTAIVEISPVDTINPGLYLLEVRVKSKATGESISKTLYINIKSAERSIREYIPAFRVELLIPQEIDPRDKIKVRIGLTNRNPLNITKMNIFVTSGLIKKEFETTLRPMENKFEEFLVQLDPIMPPISDSIKVTASTIQNNKTYKAHDGPIEFQIIGYSNIVRDTTVNKEFLKTRESIILTNGGNVAEGQTIKLKTTYFDKIFTSTIPKASLLEQEKDKYLFWEVSLAPQETTVIHITKNYRLLFFIFLILIISFTGYFLLRSPVVIKKTSVQLGKTEDDSISDIKITIFVKNRSKDVIDKAKIIDRVPRIAEIEKKFQVGTLAPIKFIRNEKIGTKIVWEIPSLEPYEERIITYKIKSKLKIIGGLSLPRAKIIYKSKNNRDMRIQSNKVEMY